MARIHAVALATHTPDAPESTVEVSAGVHGRVEAIIAATNRAVAAGRPVPRFGLPNRAYQPVPHVLAEAA